MRERSRVKAPGGAAGTVVLAEATHGLLLGGGLVTVVVAALLCWLAKPDAVLWADRTTLTSLACVFTIPLLAGLSAIVTGSRMAALSQVAATTPAGRCFPARVVWLASLPWVALVTLAQVLAPITAHSPWGTPFSVTMALPWLQTAVALAAAVSLGVLAGCRWQSWPVGPIVAALTFAWTYLSTYLPGRWNVLAPFDNSTFYRPWLEPAPQIIIAHTLLALALVALAWAVLWPGVLGPRLLASCAMLALIVGAVALASADAERSRPSALNEAPACAQSQGVRFCAWPALSADTRNIAAALASARGTVDGQWTVPTQFALAGLPSDVAGRRVEIALPPRNETLTSDALFAVLPTCTADAAGQQARMELLQWAAARAGLDQASDSPYAKLAHSSHQAQKNWVSTQLSRGGCR